MPQQLCRRSAAWGCVTIIAWLSCCAPHIASANEECSIYVNGAAGTDKTGCGAAADSACKSVARALAESTISSGTAVLCMTAATYSGALNANTSLTGVKSSSDSTPKFTSLTVRGAYDTTSPTASSIINCSSNFRGWTFAIPPATGSPPKTALSVSRVDFHSCVAPPALPGNQDSDGSGGGLLFIGDSLSVSNASFLGCHATECGGGLSAHVWRGSFAMENTVFEGCAAPIAGGGAYVATGAFSVTEDGALGATQLDVFNSTFVNNEVDGVADPRGGGLVINCSIPEQSATALCHINVSHSLFADNNVESAPEMGSVRGGAMYVGGSGITTTGSTFALDHVTLQDNVVTVSGPGQSAGTVEADGGAIAFDGHTFASFIVTDCIFSRNYVNSQVAQGAVEPIMMRGGALTITSPSVATGTVSASNEAGVVMENCLFEHNSLFLSYDNVLDVEVFGGAVYSTADSLLCSVRSLFLEWGS